MHYTLIMACVHSRDYICFVTACTVAGALLRFYSGAGATFFLIPVRNVKFTAFVNVEHTISCQDYC